MSRQPKPELFDYMVVAINPALIMVLICSLVYFLLEMFYQGQYPERLHFCLTAFIFAAVLVARISMEEGWEHAAPFGIALAVAICLAMHRFVSYEHTGVEAVGWIINYGLIALAWWCANKLTWDCTLIDETQDASGEGLLQTVGLDSAAPIGESKAEAAPAVDKTPPTKAVAANKKSNGDGRGKAFDDDLEWSTKKDSAADGKSWWQRFLDRRRRPHAPGVWVVYFSLAALPIFGVGQTFIAAENTASRRYAFVLLCVYVASAMGLLLTTSFLSLRRYLRQRRLEMPLTMAGTWLATGAILIVSLVALTALVPRPNAEYQISALPALGSEEHDASKTAAGREGTKDEQAESRTGRHASRTTRTPNPAIVKRASMRMTRNPPIHRQKILPVRKVAIRNITNRKRAGTPAERNRANRRMANRKGAIPPRAIRKLTRQAKVQTISRNPSSPNHSRRPPIKNHRRQTSNRPSNPVKARLRKRLRSVLDRGQSTC